MKPSTLCGTSVHEDRPRYEYPCSSKCEGQGTSEGILLLIVSSPENVLLLSPFLLNELERVFEYDRVRTATKLTDEEVAEYMTYLRARGVSDMVFPGPAPR